MKVKNKILTIMVVGVALSTLIIPNKANAALQSNGGTPAKKNFRDWALQIRQMQEMGATLGRTDKIDTNTLISNATDLDIHLEKNIEYGAMAILSASAYGNPSKINDGETTTGNSTGIVININKERVSAWPDARISSDILGNYNKRYYDLYEINNGMMPISYKSGDALNETYKWHGAGEWAGFNYQNCGIIRAYSNSIFGFYGGDGGEGYYNCNYTVPQASRACIVVGTGL